MEGMMNFKEAYESQDTNWKDKVGSREEMNAYIDYKRARDGGASHEEAIAQVAETAQGDTKFKEVAARLPTDPMEEWHTKHRESLERTATGRKK